ncbi:hypothetical protein L6V77_28250 [Myxococcota bacterium]|nr:hypothetical protein [Myxococcota bacterium]
MAEQLTIFDVWETVVREPLPQPLPRSDPDAVEPDPVLPGQQSLLSGVHLGESEVDRALATCDAHALRAAYATTSALYPHYRPAAAWPAWADALERLAAGTPRERLSTAQRLADPDFAAALFPDIGPERFADVYTEAIRLASCVVLDAEGPTARGGGGECLVARLLDMERLADARRYVTMPAPPGPDLGVFLRLRARYESASGASPAASRRAWLCASLVAPGETALDPALPAEFGDLLEEATELALDGEPGEWLAALADLDGLCPVPPDELPLAESTGTRFASDLALLRAMRRRGAPESDARAVKARLLRAAPPLKDRLRSI